ncbi:MAG TPA: transcriptional regulator [Cyclobacteriaceae bacterium]
MRRFTLITCFLFINLAVFSQIELLEEQLIKNPKGDTQRVNLLNKLARLHFITSPVKTEAYASEALTLSEKLNYQIGQAKAYFNKSLIHKLKGQTALQIEKLLRALAIYESNQDTLMIANTLAEMGTAYQQQQDTTLAKNYLGKAGAYYHQLKNKQGEALILRRMGTLENEKGNRRRAIQYSHQALSIEKELNSKEGIANVMNNIGVDYYELQEYDSALAYYLPSLAIQKEINNLNRLPAAYHNIGRVYLAQGKTNLALKIAQLGLPIARKTDNRYAILESTLLLADIFQAKKDFKNTALFLRQHAQIKDSLLNRENENYFAKLKALIETEQKEKEIQFLKKEQEWMQFRQWIIYLASGAFLLIGVLVIVYQRNLILNKKLLMGKTKEVYETNQALAQVELENRRLTETQLQYDLEFRHKELLTYTLSLAQKNVLMEEMREGIREVLVQTNPESRMKLTRLIKLIDHSLESEKDWDEFRMYFEKVHSSFFENLKKGFPDLTQSDLRLSALIHLNLSMKEVANLMGISPESVKMARHRLRKKLNLQTDENLGNFLGSFNLTGNQQVANEVNQL